jgi:hypothetical protein
MMFIWRQVDIRTDSGQIPAGFSFKYHRMA